MVAAAGAVAWAMGTVMEGTPVPSKMLIMEEQVVDVRGAGGAHPFLGQVGLPSVEKLAAEDGPTPIYKHTFE